MNGIVGVVDYSKDLFVGSIIATVRIATVMKIVRDAKENLMDEIVMMTATKRFAHVVVVVAAVVAVIVVAVVEKPFVLPVVVVLIMELVDLSACQ